MILSELPLPGAFLITPEKAIDERGYFARIFSREEFEAQGLNPAVEQCNLSYNARRLTLRGMHYQAEPHGECKVVRCTRGVIYDVAVDIRPGSPTYLEWHAVELSAENALAVYLPEGVAHGFLTLAEDCEVLYQMSTGYVPTAARGVRWDDPAFSIAWPESPTVISDRDRQFPDFSARSPRS